MADEVEKPTVSLNLGGAFSEKVSEIVDNMDIKTVLKKMIDMPPEGQDNGETKEQLQGILEKIEAMSDEEREEFMAKIKQGLMQKLNFNLGQNIDLSGLETAIKEAIVQKLYMVGAIVAFIVFLLLVFFGYKLYKSIKDKEVKREEKKKAKQLKKKK
ncbi:uncharacterized protein LOC101737272 [Bombyx mori]|uniref:Uncharacterized protein n=1 Tax=Bombyx mori TaxID=7091 RepID=A0A8R2C9H6_BOMMO|nr:uncharacterized protein LOC101737272 [Bombyx mori]